jgi:sigma-B regulation protein RsbU (phosphoserine phosphatase)
MTRVLPDSDFLTVFYLVIDPKTLKFSYCNAGHPRPFLFRYAGGETHELRTGGPLLGAFPNMRYEEEEGILFPGDRILLYTDGITETSNTAGEFYGEDALRSLALLNMRRPGKEILDLIMLDLDRFRGSAPLNDDISVIMISAE